MKILAIADPNSAVHTWRIRKPMTELQKHVDWTIDIRPALVEDYHGLEKNPDEFVSQYGDEMLRKLRQYDIIYTSYFTSPHLYTLLWAVEKHYNTKVIIDIDDDVFDVDPSNVVWWQSVGWQGHDFLKTIARISPRLTTTTQVLADKLADRSGVSPSITVLPNCIDDSYEDREADNGNDIVIGYFGGISHYSDLHESGVLKAIKQLMRENKRIKFKLCGQPLDVSLPKSRVTEVEVGHGDDWTNKVLPSMNLDIAIAPLLHTEFNKYKSNIKWQESTRMGSVFVASDYGVYEDMEHAVLVDRNTKAEWYKALKPLVDDKVKRQEIVKYAKKALDMSWRLEDNWHEYKDMLERVHASK